MTMPSSKEINLQFYHVLREERTRKFIIKANDYNTLLIVFNNQPFQGNHSLVKISSSIMSPKKQISPSNKKLWALFNYFIINTNKNEAWAQK